MFRHMRRLPWPGAWHPRSGLVKALGLAAGLAVLLIATEAHAGEGQTELTDDQEAYLREHVWAVLGTGRKDGSPQLSMIAYEYDGADIAISIKSYTAKWKNVLRQPKVALLVHDGRKQLIVYGTVKAVKDDPERRDLIRRVMTKLRPEAAALDDATLTKVLDEQQRTAFRLIPEKAFLND